MQFLSNGGLTYKYVPARVLQYVKLDLEAFHQGLSLEFH